MDVDARTQNPLPLRIFLKLKHISYRQVCNAVETFMLACSMNRKTLPKMGDIALIDLIRTRFNHRSPAVALGIGDDCAILRPPSGQEIVVTTDFSLEGRHFTRTKHPPSSAGHRCLARGLSDLAAMGA